MYKFVATDVSNPPQKRKQPQRACEQCRRKKKRCHHTNAERSPQSYTARSSPQLDGHEGAGLSHSPVSASYRGPSSPVMQHTVQESVQSPPQPNRQAESHRKHGSLSIGGGPNNSEQLRVNQSSEGLSSRFIGDLNPESILVAATSPDATRGASSLNESIGVWHTRAVNNNAPKNGSLNVSAQSRSRSLYESSSMIPKLLVPVLEAECLSTLPTPASIDALSNIYFEKIYPILPLIDKSRFHAMESTDPARILLQQGICLAASKNFAAKQHLTISGSGSLLSFGEFEERMSAAMRLSIEMRLVTDKVVLIQALALMSHFMDGPDGGDISSQFCAMAVNHTQSVGLHIGQRQSDGDQYGATLFCCVWALDRMNAAFHGRPVLIHERDVQRNLEQCIEQQEPCFRLLLLVVELLDKVIRLYRPSTNASEDGVEINFPSFEELVATCAGSQIVTSYLATIETLYHSVAILSCRSKTWEAPHRSSTSYLRQNLSSLSVSSAVSRELPDQLVLFPFVPYAISLSLSIAYREMRHSKIPICRARSRAQFQICCDILQELGQMFWSASTMAEMGKSTLREMDRVFFTVANSEQRKQQQGAVNRSVNLSRVGGSSTAGSSAWGAVPANLPALLSVQTQNNALPMQDFDPSLLDSISDIDLFGMFDPAFDLNGVDACLEGNLNLSFPTHFQ